jgi:hypothetical protein
MDTAGGNVKLLAAGPLHSPAWSPDGKWIALDGDPGDCKFEVYIMQADGSDLHAITSHPDSCGGYNKHPTWSPEGDWIVFWSQRSDPKYTDLYKIKRDGSEETQITFSEINQGIYNSPTDPAWMPILVTEDANQPEFTFDYPTDWQPMSDLWPNYLPEDNYKNLGLAELVAVTSVHEQGGAGIWFVVAKRSLNGSELKAFIDQTYAQTVPEIEGLSTSTAETGAWVGLEYRYRRPWGEPWWEFRDIWFEKEGSAYLLSFHAYDLTEYEGAMQTVLDSFTFK